MKNSKVMRLLAAVLTIGLLATGCGSSSSDNSASDAAVSVASEKSAEASTESSESGEESTAASGKDTLNVGISADPINLDPNDNNSQHVHRVKTQIYETLVARDENQQLTGGLAESWEWEDETHILFHIRQNVQFHSGDILTAEDVAFSIERAYGMGAANVALSHVDIDNCEVVDEYTYRLALTDAYTPQIAWLEWPLTAISCKKTVEESGEDYMASPNGTGPYKLKNWVSGDRVELEAFENYWGGEPAVKNLNMIIVTESTNRAIMLETGELDVAYDISSVDYERIKNGDETTIVESPSHNINYIGMSCLNGPFTDVRVRQAVAHAIDVDASFQAAYNGVHQRATSFVDPEVDGYAAVELPTYDPEQAKSLLTEAGYPDGFTCNLYTNDDAERIALAEAIQSYLAQVGINAEIVTLEMGAYSEIIDDNSLEGIFILGATCTTVEAEKILANFLSTSPGSMNTSGYRNEAFDTLYNEAVTLQNDEERWAEYKQLFEILAADVPWIPTYDKMQLTGVRNDVKGFSNGSFECAKFKYVSFE